MATVQLVHSSKPMTSTGSYRWWPCVSGRFYDFNGRPWVDGDQPMTNAELQAAFEQARDMRLSADDMYWRDFDEAHEQAVLEAQDWYQDQAMLDDIRSNAPEGW